MTPEYSTILVAIIGAAAAIFTAGIAAFVALRAQGKQIHTLVNSNLARVSNQLELASQRIEAQNKFLQALTPETLVAGQAAEATLTATAATAATIAAATIATALSDKAAITSGKKP